MKRIKIIYLVLIASLIYSGGYSQNLITVEHSGASTFYQSLDSALAHSVNGDNVYLPGASYNIGTLNIEKGIHITGAGCNFDSTLATGATIFLGTLKINTGSDNGSLEGIYINGDIYFGTNSGNQEIHNYSVRRCYMNNLNLSFDGVSQTASSNLFISENIIKGNISGGNAQNVEVSKSILENTINNFNGNAVFSNNILLRNACGDHVINNVNAVTFQNNISLLTFCSYWGSYFLMGSGTGNSFINNSFICDNPIPAGNINNGNIFKINTDSLFINQTGNIYNIKHNYHLKSECKGKNSGTDRTDVGIYGTASPAKDGQTPFNPHIQTKTIPSSTNAEGNLNINIKVKAQEN